MGEGLHAFVGEEHEVYGFGKGIIGMVRAAVRCMTTGRGEGCRGSKSDSRMGGRYGEARS
mgnify:CR=1 FL=1